MRSTAIIFLLFISVYSAFAVKAYPKAVKVTQPDGTSIMVLIHGDEHYRYVTTLSGIPVACGTDGFYHFAEAPNADIIRANNSMPYKTLAASVKTRKSLILLVQFSDVKFSVDNPKTHFDKMLNQEGYSDFEATGSAKDYFKDNLNGYYNISFDVTDVISLPQTIAYYGQDDESVPSVVTYDVNMPLLIRDACEAVRSKYNFADYDLDNDGVVDHVFVFFAGYNEAEGGDKNTIWPHTFSVESKNYIYNGKKIGTYGCASELKGASGRLPAGIGTFCHEYSHSLGLKDLYDVNYASGGLSKCLWKTLSIMDEGNYNNEGRTPPYYCAIDRELSNVAEFSLLSVDREYSLSPINVNGTILKANTSIRDEYYLFENRSSSQKWDKYIGGNGMVVYHIDKSVNYAGGIKAYVRWDKNLINADASHECADLVESLDSASIVSQVFFPGQGNVKEFSATSNPGFEDWNGDPLGMKLLNIRQTGENVAFNVVKDDTERLLQVIAPQVTPYQKDALVKWKTNKEGIFSWGLRWGLKSSDESLFKDTTINKLSFSIEGLSAKTEYKCQIFYKGKKMNGDTTSVEFTTGSYTSSFPYIYSIKNEYSVGDTVMLKVQNLVEEVSSVQWSVDGVQMTDNILIFITPGIKKLSLMMVYAKDGSSEIITKKCYVKEKKIK